MRPPFSHHPARDLMGEVAQEIRTGPFEFSLSQHPGPGKQAFNKYHEKEDLNGSVYYDS